MIRHTSRTRLKHCRSSAAWLPKNRGDRRASILICVIIVMIICGGMSLQSSRMLSATLDNCVARTRWDQLQEILALGRMRLREQLTANQAYAGESFEVAVKSEQGASSHRRAKIQIEPLPPKSETEPQQWRVTVVFPDNTQNSNTVTWESR